MFEQRGGITGTVRRRDLQLLTVCVLSTGRAADPVTDTAPLRPTGVESVAEKNLDRYLWPHSSTLQVWPLRVFP